VVNGIDFVNAVHAKVGSEDGVVVKDGVCTGGGLVASRPRDLPVLIECVRQDMWSVHSSRRCTCMSSYGL
jgi:hypothetical protein